MSPSGRLKLASTVRIAGIEVRYRFCVVLLFSTIKLIAVSDAFPSHEAKDSLRTTPVYDSDYYENGVFNGFDSKLYAEALPPDGEIKERIIPINVKSIKIGETIRKQYVEEEKVALSERGMGKIEKNNAVGRTEVKTYCSAFESKCRCSADGRELACKAAGFVEVPSSLPSTLTKL